MASGSDLSATALAGEGGNKLTSGESMGIDPQQMERYIAVWKEVRAMIDAGAEREAIDAVVYGSGLEKELQRQMRAQVDLTMDTQHED